jgi:hypothetical protein
MNRTIVTIALLSLTLGTAADAGTTPPALPDASSAQSYQTLAFNGSGAPAPMMGSPISNSNIPGATGRTIVPGDSSTVAGDGVATRMQQTGAYSGD